MPKKGSRGRDLWVIEFSSVDTSQDATVAYGSRKEAIDAAVDFVKYHAKEERGAFEWKPEDPAPEVLDQILTDIKQGKMEEAIMGWLDYQSEYDPDEKIAIGPSGSVSDSAGDFPA